MAYVEPSHMPWDETELWTGELGYDGLLKTSRPRRGWKSRIDIPAEWSPDGQLYFVSDRSGWGNLYRVPGTGTV